VIGWLGRSLSRERTPSGRALLMAKLRPFQFGFAFGEMRVAERAIRRQDSGLCSPEIAPRLKVSPGAASFRND
jgi:hypothetical protein